MMWMLALSARAAPLISEIDWGPECKPVPSGEDRWWKESNRDDALRLVEVDLTVHPLAKCNDGTPAVYYARSGSASSNWIIHLQGGGACADHASCKERWCYGAASDYSGEMMSSLNSFERLDTGGITNPDLAQNRFADWNTVWIHSCSSDFFLGRAEAVVLSEPGASDQDFAIHFLGREIIDAVLSDLGEGAPTLAWLGMPSLKEAERILLTGTTSGAAGVVHGVDELSERLRQIAPGADVRAVLDSTAYPAADTAIGAPYTGGWDPDTIEAYLILRAEFSLYGVTPDAECLDGRAAFRDEGWCQDRMYQLSNHVSTPFFVFTDLNDPENPLCKGTPECVALHRAQGAAYALIADPDVPGRLLPPSYPEGAPLPGVAMPDCGGHAVLTNADSIGFLHKKIPVGTYVAGATEWMSVHDLLWNWAVDTGGLTTLIRDPDPGAPTCPTPPPSAPMDITAVFDAARNAVVVDWAPVAFALGYVVHEDIADPVPDSGGTLTAVEAPPWQDPGPLGGVRCYAVSATNTEGESGISQTRCVDTGLGPFTLAPAGAESSGTEPTRTEPTPRPTSPVPPGSTVGDADVGGPAALRGCGCQTGGAPRIAPPALLLAWAVRRRQRWTHRTP
jgi:MYXO-CTERM domain-containing protein